MLIGEVLEKTPSVTASENMANRLADRIRNIWLDNTKVGIHQWEANFFEDPDGIRFLRGESFPNLQGIDYIFRWWGSKFTDEAAGELEVLWKVIQDDRVVIFKSWIRFATRDFIIEAVTDESKRRERTRADFRRAFQIWQRLYLEQVAAAQ